MGHLPKIQRQCLGPKMRDHERPHDPTPLDFDKVFAALEARVQIASPPTSKIAPATPRAVRVFGHCCCSCHHHPFSTGRGRPRAPPAGGRLGGKGTRSGRKTMCRFCDVVQNTEANLKCHVLDETNLIHKQQQKKLKSKDGKMDER